MNPAPVKTSWLSVLVLISAGGAVALQVGKVPAALPSLQSELGLTLVQSGWVLAIFGLIAAGFGTMLGTLADRYGQLNVAVFGMVLAAAAGIAGGFAPNGSILLATRAFEGLGFILTSVSIPPLIALAASGQDRKVSLALWGTYMPTGSGLMLIASGPILYLFDWRILWWITAAIILAIAIPVYKIGSRLTARHSTDAAKPKPGEILAFMRRPGPLLLSLIFMFYSGQFLILSGFLPLILIELNGFSPVLAAFASAIVVLLNGVGNGVSSWLHSRGLNPVMLIIIGCIGMALGGAVAFWPDVSGTERIVAAGIFCGFGGLIPSSLFTEVPQHVSRQSLLASINGMLVQGSAIGQLAGTPLAAAFVAWYGNWQAAIPVMVIAAGMAACCALMLARIDKRNTLATKHQSPN